MKAFVPLVAFSVMLGGCSTLEGLLAASGDGTGLELLKQASEVGGVVEEKTLGNAMKALPYYCKLPLSGREILRNRANARPEAGGAKIGVVCPTDPPLTLQAE